MKKLNCQSLRKHTGLWSIAPAQPVMSASAGTFSIQSIRTSYNDEGLPGSFIEGAGYAKK
jgi:hypothetical protein